MSSKYSIKDLERISGIKAHTLRVWEQRYNILRPERTSTNIRYYGDSDLKRILNISLLNSNGFKISNIARLNENSLIEEVNKLLAASQQESHQIDTLVLCLVSMDEDRFELTVNNSIIQFGFENTIEKILFPFLRHLGNLWQLNVITPAQEHYISNLIRQKLIVGLDNIKPKKNANALTYLFFLPEHEQHEMGLLYTHYLTKKKGHKCVYLGQSVPDVDLFSISQKVKPDVIVTILTNPFEADELNSFFANCHKQLSKSRILLSGRMFYSTELPPKLPSENFRLFKDYQEFKTML